ncbi:MAG: DUF1778 domain-containing protein [Betaproteobacteria bacterium]|nr:DUF1778 domain-containing protein [Betaproteobacteria bacterium]
MPTMEIPSIPAVRDSTINILVLRAQRELIDRAARLAGRNRSDFMPSRHCRMRRSSACWPRGRLGSARIEVTPSRGLHHACLPRCDRTLP